MVEHQALVAAAVAVAVEAAVAVVVVVVDVPRVVWVVVVEGDGDDGEDEAGGACVAADGCVPGWRRSAAGWGAPRACGAPCCGPCSCAAQLRAAHASRHGHEAA